MQLTTNGLSHFSNQPLSSGKMSRVLSSADNAFGCFLAGLAGEDAPFEPVSDLNQEKVTRSGGGMSKPVAMLQSGRSVVVFMDRSERWPGEP